MPILRLPQEETGMTLRWIGLQVLCALAAVAVLACSPREETGTPAPAGEPAVDAAPDAPAGQDAAAQFDAPPSDVKSTEKVRCLVDSPPGCAGCDKGDTCAYEELTRYDCVYVVYGTDCSK
jgi:hypothetical protein